MPKAEVPVWSKARRLLAMRVLAMLSICALMSLDFNVMVSKMVTASRRLIVACLVASIIIALPARAEKLSDEQISKLDSYIGNAMTLGHIPGLSLAVVKNDEVALVKGYGLRKASSDLKVDGQTIFAIGSNTKSFTSLGLAKLVDEGKIKWDTKVIDCLPGASFADPYVTSEVTLRDLLCHRTGLPGKDLAWYAAPADRSQLLHRIRYLKADHSFRSQYAYNNLMYFTAGEALASVSGKSWDTFVRDEILAPLEMKRSSTSTQELNSTSNVAAPHTFENGKIFEIKYRNIDNIAPAGAINSCAEDMAQWLRLQLAEGSYNGKQLISKDSIHEMWSPQINMTVAGKAPVFNAPRTNFGFYGLGWVIQDIYGHKCIWHTGGIDGMSAVVGLVPDYHTGFVILTNCDGKNDLLIGLANCMFDRILEARETDWLGQMNDFNVKKTAQGKDENKERKLADSGQAIGHPSLPLASYVGTYENPLFDPITIAPSSDASLSFEWGAARTAVLHNFAFDTFQAQWQDHPEQKSLVQFMLSARGEVEGLKLDDEEFVRARK